VFVSEESGGPGRAYLVQADVRGRFPIADRSVHCCVTSPPYFGLRDYGDPRQIGLEPTPEAYVASVVEVFREVRRVLRDDGTLWLNIGDSYANTGGHTKQGDSSQRQGRSNVVAQHSVKGSIPLGTKQKDLIGVPWMLAFALRADGWYLRSEVTWEKRNAMPESVTDRPSSCTEKVFLLTKSPRYFYDRFGETAPVADPDRVRSDRFGGNKYVEGVKHSDGSVFTGQANGKNLRNVWTINTRPFPGAHFACFPPELPARCIRLGTSEAGCCPSCGAPYVRVVERRRAPTRPGAQSKVYEADDGLKQDAVGKRTYVGFNARYKASMEVGNRDPLRHVTSSRTVRWDPSCSCIAAALADGERDRGVMECLSTPGPCVVLDPFCGSGTTVGVARELGRVGLGIDVKSEYLEMARGRIGGGLLRTARRRRSPARIPSQMELFEDWNIVR
jgi:DNA modification methylase